MKHKYYDGKFQRRGATVVHSATTQPVSYKRRNMPELRFPGTFFYGTYYGGKDRHICLVSVLPHLTYLLCYACLIDGGADSGEFTSAHFC